MAEANIPKKLGRYDIVCELGKGAMGVVYEGKDPNIGRRVAIKTARRDIMEASGMADEMMARFLREAQAAGGLNHPNIITIFDADEQDGIAYIAMEYLEGGDLQDVLDKRSRMGEKEIVEIGATICEALAAAHDQGIVHRDIKPANIMVPDKGPIKVADFGIAHVSDSNLTQEGALIGTPHYMSPEQFMGQKVDGRSDLFSVGVILYEMLTGEKPFTGEALSTVMHHVIKSDPVPPSELNFSVSDALNQVVLKAMNKRPNDRYADGRVFAAALRECLEANPDPHILATGVPQAESTMMAGADPDATALGVQTPADATVIAAIADQDAATVTKPPPQELKEAPETDATLLSGAPAKEKKKSPALLLAGAGAIAALVIIVGVVAKLGGGGDTDNGGGVSPSGESYYGRVKLFVYGTTNFEAWAKYNGKEIGPKDMEDIWKLVEVDIRVYDNGSADMPTVGEAKGYNALDDDFIVLTGKPKAIGFEITYGDLEPQPYLVERVAEDPNQLATNHERPVCIDLSE